MKVAGHKTNSVFERYDIVNEDDMKTAALMRQTYLDAQKKNVVKVTQFPDKKEKVSSL